MAEETNNNDELVSQFLAFTGSADVDRASSYLEMSGGNLETAVGLYMEHTTSGGASAGIPADNNMADVRAPDETRTMRLMDHGMPPGGGGGGGGYNPLLGALMQGGDDDDDDEDFMERASAFSRGVMMDPRAAVNAAAAAAAAAAANENEDDDEEEQEGNAPNVLQESKQSEALIDMFAPPTHLMHKAGGFQGARAVAKDSKRWLLVNIQRDSEFSSHALNRDVWRDDLVENLVRSSFIFYQTMDTTTEGRTFIERYGVHDFPHVSIIDARTGRLLWRKEGWTQENPLTAQDFAEISMDFCSRHSLDKPPANPHKRKIESQELQAAMQASMNNDDDDDEEIQYEEEEQEEEEKGPSFVDTLLEVTVGDEPETGGARISIRMPDAKRLVRKFSPQDSVKSIYAFVAQSNDEAKGGKEFTLSAGYPPKDLLDSIDDTIESCGLAGEAITVRWKA